MSTDEQRVCAAWQEAARDLGFQLTTPFPHNAPDGRSFTYTALIHGFGGPKGALLAILRPDRSLSDYPHAEGYHLSLLSAESYENYDRQHFIETLDDLGWFGPEAEKPEWYTGKPWTPATSNQSLEPTAGRCDEQI